MSAIDLFASALGAFIVLSMLLFPSYMKTKTLEQSTATAKQEINRQETRKAHLEEMVKKAAVDVTEAAKARAKAAKLNDELANLTALNQDGTKWEAKLLSAIKNPAKFVVLGHRTHAKSFTILVDMSLGLTVPRDYRPTLIHTVKRIISGLGYNRPFRIIGYRVTGTVQNNREEIFDWPGAGKGLRLASEQNQAQALDFLRLKISKPNGLADTRDALFKAMETKADAIILITYDLPTWPMNLTSDKVVKEVTARNKGQQEIQTVALGPALDSHNFYKNSGSNPQAKFFTFMQDLARENRGDFSAVAN